MDAFAVSIAKEIVIDRQRKKTALLIASFFGGFQMLMPRLKADASKGTLS